MDVQTILILLILGHILNFLIIYGYAYKRTNYVLNLFMIAQFIFFFAFSALYIRTLYVNPLTIIVSNSALAAAFSFQSASLLQATEDWNHTIKRNYILFLTPSMCVFYYFSFFKDLEHIRIILMTLILLCILIYPTIRLIFNTNKSLVRMIISFAYLFALLTFSLRIFDTIVLTKGMTLISSITSNVLTFLSLYLFMIINGIGILLVIKEKDDLKLLEAASTDELTGLYNRRYLLQNFDKILEQHKRNNKSMAMIMMDLDHFKKVNDNYGHDQGDVVLKTFARVISKQLRSYDVLSRFGGEEFILLLPETNKDYALNIANRLKSEIKNMTVDNIKITVSLGVYSTIPLADDDFSSFFRKVDDALYHSKNKGRDAISVWEENN